MISDSEWNSMDREIKAYKSLKLEEFWFLVEYLEKKKFTNNQFIENCKNLFNESMKGIESITKKYL